MKKKLICLLIMSSAILAGCTAKTENGVTTDQTLASGTYVGTGIGFNGELKVEVEVTDGKIVDIKALENGESPVVFDRALPVITERIIEAQTPVVDSVSAASFSSFGVKSAVADAMRQAGFEVEEIKFTTKGPEVEKKDLEEVKTQLVIVGGGPAGLSAAIEAKEAGVEDIIVVEKLDILSGNGKFDLNFYDMVNTEAQRANGIEDSAEKFYEDTLAKTWDSEERKIAQAEGATELDTWLRDMGCELNYNYGKRNHMAEEERYAGDLIQEKMEEKINELGIEVRTGTKGLDLIMEDGKAIGVKVECKEGYYDIKADAVIVATGGFSNNKELLEKYAPGTEKLSNTNQIGATGDFISVFESHDLKLDKLDVVRVIKATVSGFRDVTNGSVPGYIFVNKDGERFIDETKGEMEMADAIYDQGTAYYIFDQNVYDGAYNLRKQEKLGYFEKADTLEELAEKLGINAENLVSTVDTYNKAIAGEIADPFREKVNENQFAESGPYYGFKFESAVHQTKGGVVANEKAEIINNNDEVVEGLYGAGEVVAQSQSYTASVIFGRISGQEAAKHILSK